MQDTVRLLSTLALKGAILSLAARYQAEAGAVINADFAPTVPLLDRLRGGEAADVVILTREGLEGLKAEGIVVAESCVDLARSFVGLAVKAGADHPDIATEPAFRAALLGGAFGGLFRPWRQRHFLRATDRADGDRRRDHCPRLDHPPGFYRGTAPDRGGRSGGAADQRIETGRGH